MLQLPIVGGGGEGGCQKRLGMAQHLLRGSQDVGKLDPGLVLELLRSLLLNKEAVGRGDLQGCSKHVAFYDMM